MTSAEGGMALARVMGITTVTGAGAVAGSEGGGVLDEVEVVVMVVVVRKLVGVVELAMADSRATGGGTLSGGWVGDAAGTVEFWPTLENTAMLFPVVVSA